MRAQARKDRAEISKLRVELAASRAAKKHFEDAAQACTRVLQAANQQQQHKMGGGVGDTSPGVLD